MGYYENPYYERIEMEEINEISSTSTLKKAIQTGQTAVALGTLAISIYGLYMLTCDLIEAAKKKIDDREAKRNPYTPK